MRSNFRFLLCGFALFALSACASQSAVTTASTSTTTTTPTINIAQGIADLKILNTAATLIAPALETQYGLTTAQSGDVSAGISALGAAITGAQSATSTSDAQAKIAAGETAFNSIVSIAAGAPGVPTDVKSALNTAAAVLPALEAVAGLVATATGIVPASTVTTAATPAS